MALLDKLKQLDRQRQQLLNAVEPAHLFTDRIESPTHAIVNGRPMVLFGTNNYLGLTFDPDSIEAGREALLREGTGTTGSRMANGNYAAHGALERELADFFGRRHGLVFSTGYSANTGMISGLAGPGDVVLIDADSHASIYDACRLCGAEIIRFRHDDARDLERRLQRIGDRAENALIVVEGLYSMLGDRADLAGICALKEQTGALLLVDEAHSLGIYGEKGRGMCEAAGVEHLVDFVVGTFSKSLGTTGGYCVSDHPELELLRYGSRPFMFTASPCPSVVACTRSALATVRARPELRARLWSNVERLHRILSDLGGWDLGEPSPVIPLLFPDPLRAVAAWEDLLERGIYVNLVLPPAAPNGASLLRLSLSAAHSEEDIDLAADALTSLAHAAAANSAD